MQRHEVPTHLNIEDKAFAGLTMRQLMVAIIGLALAYSAMSEAPLPPARPPSVTPTKPSSSKTPGRGLTCLARAAEAIVRARQSSSSGTGSALKPFALIGLMRRRSDGDPGPGDLFAAGGDVAHPHFEVGGSLVNLASEHIQKDAITMARVRELKHVS